LIDASGASGALQAMSRDFTRFTLHAVSEGTSIGKSMDWGYVASSTGRLGGSRKAQVKATVHGREDAPDMLAQWKAMKHVLDQVLPDIVLFDHTFHVLQQWVEKENIPTVILHTPYFMTGTPTGCARMSLVDKVKLMHLAFIEDAKEEVGLCREGAAGMRRVEGNSPHTLIFCEPELLNSATIPSRAHVVGPCFSSAEMVVADKHLLPWLGDAHQRGQQVLYVALGTLANSFLSAETVATLLDSFNALGAQWRVLWSLPAAQHDLLHSSGRQYDAEHIRVETYVSQRGVLAHPAVHLFLSHGGQSSVNEGLSAGVPLLCMPFFCDQYEVAQAVVSHGLGLVFHKDELLAGDHKRLVELLSTVANESLFSETAKRHAELLRLRAGCGRAAEVVESIVHAGADYQELWQWPKLPTKSCFEGIASMIWRR